MMTYATEDITKALKAAREAKGLSQRDLSGRTGIPQSHLSKIESGRTDIRLSSLIEIARVLDLELTLVPRSAILAVKTLLRSAASPSAASQADPRPAYRLDEDGGDGHG
jgi:transcriptional regulator with XRE-family HTH domain